MPGSRHRRYHRYGRYALLLLFAANHLFIVRFRCSAALLAIAGLAASIRFVHYCARRCALIFGHIRSSCTAAFGHLPHCWLIINAARRQRYLLLSWHRLFALLLLMPLRRGFAGRYCIRAAPLRSAASPPASRYLFPLATLAGRRRMIVQFRFHNSYAGLPII